MSQAGSSLTTRWSIIIGLLIAVSVLWWRGLSHLNPQHTIHLAPAQDIQHLIFSKLEEQGLSPPQVKLGVYPLIGEQFSEQSMFPLISTSCPLGTTCERLIEMLSPVLIAKKYRLVPSAQIFKKGRSMYYAVAKGNTPVLALRFSPVGPHLSVLLHTPQYGSISIQALTNLPKHITFTLNPMTSTGRKAYDHLTSAQREVFLYFDPLEWSVEQLQEEISQTQEEMFLENTTGTLDQTHLHTLFTPILSQLRKIIRAYPHLTGVYIPSLTLSYLQKSELHSLISLLYEQRLILINRVMEMNPFVRSFAQVNEVRLTQVSHVIDPQHLIEGLKGVDASLVIDGEAIIEIPSLSLQQTQDLSRWLKTLVPRGVHVSRFSEVAL